MTNENDGAIENCPLSTDETRSNARDRVSTVEQPTSDENPSRSDATRGVGGCAGQKPRTGASKAEPYHSSSADQRILTDGGRRVTCPACGEAVTGLSTSGPSDHRVQPCGHRVGEAVVDDFFDEHSDDGDDPGAPVPVPDGGTTAMGTAVATVDDPGWHDCTAFQRDLLLEMARIDAGLNPTPPKGLAIKDALEQRYDEAVNHGRLYPNLTDLVTAGLVEKGELDGRTNSYDLTDAGERALRQHAQEIVEIANGGER